MQTLIVPPLGTLTGEAPDELSHFPVLSLSTTLKLDECGTDKQDHLLQYA